MNEQSRVVDIFPKSNRITIIPAELHQSLSRADGFHRPTYSHLLRRLLTEPDTYAILPGDVSNSGRPTMRDRQAIAYAERDRASAKLEADENVRAGLEKGIIRDLEPVKHKILGALDGDHFEIFANGWTSTRHIFESLKIPDAYLGERVGYINLRLHRPNNRSHNDTLMFSILVRHGKGSCATIGSDINKLMAQSMPGGFLADLYIGGHTHKHWVYSEPFAYTDRTGRVRWKPIGWARAGNTLLAYGKGRPTYPEIAELRPLPVGYPDVYLNLGWGPCRNLVVESIKGLH